MSVLTIIALVLVVVSLLLVMLRLLGRGGVVELTSREISETRQEVLEGRMQANLDAAYQEVLNLADVQLAQDELVLAGCGRRGEVEQVMLATNNRLFLFARRFGASRYSYDIFDYGKLHPIPISQAVIGERIRMLEGDRLAEMPSPGMESWLDTAEDTIKVINDRIRRAKIAAVEV